MGERVGGVAVSEAPLLGSMMESSDCVSCVAAVASCIDSAVVGSTVAGVVVGGIGVVVG